MNILKSHPYIFSLLLWSFSFTTMTMDPPVDKKTPQDHYIAGLDWEVKATKIAKTLFERAMNERPGDTRSGAGAFKNRNNHNNTSFKYVKRCGENAIKEYELAANQNHEEALRRLAEIFLEGKIVDQNIDASKLYTSRIRNNVEKNKSKDNTEFKKQTLVGEIQHKLFDKYLLGKGYLNSDNPEIVKNGLNIIKRAAEAREPNAAFLMGVIYRDGRYGNSKDLTLACENFELAAEGNVSDARAEGNVSDAREMAINCYSVNNIKKAKELADQYISSALPMTESSAWPIRPSKIFEVSLLKDFITRNLEVIMLRSDGDLEAKFAWTLAWRYWWTDGLPFYDGAHHIWEELCELSRPPYLDDPDVANAVDYHLAIDYLLLPSLHEEAKSFKAFGLLQNNERARWFLYEIYFLLGICHLTGRGTPYNAVLANLYFREAKKFGNVYAGMILELPKRYLDLTPDELYEKALHQFKEGPPRQTATMFLLAAYGGHQFSQLALGRCFRDFAELAHLKSHAAYWLDIASTHTNDPKIKLELKQFIDDEAAKLTALKSVEKIPRVVPKKKKSRGKKKKVAQEVVSSSETNVSTNNPPEAKATKRKNTFEEVKAAARQGDRFSQYTLGIMYFTGDGVGQNSVAAVEYLLSFLTNANEFDEKYKIDAIEKIKSVFPNYDLSSPERINVLAESSHFYRDKVGHGPSTNGDGDATTDARYVDYFLHYRLGVKYFTGDGADKDYSLAVEHFVEFLAHADNFEEKFVKDATEKILSVSKDLDLSSPEKIVELANNPTSKARVNCSYDTFLKMAGKKLKDESHTKITALEKNGDEGITSVVPISVRFDKAFTFHKDLKNLEKSFPQVFEVIKLKLRDPDLTSVLVPGCGDKFKVRKAYFNIANHNIGRVYYINDAENHRLILLSTYQKGKVVDLKASKRNALKAYLDSFEPQPFLQL